MNRSERRLLPEKLVLIQKPMLRVCYALLPLVASSVYLFGWRSLALTAFVLVIGFATEALFTFTQGKPATSAVFVTCLIFSLSLPPSLPFWMAAVGIAAGVALGKMIFGGFGKNVFNPAMVGRCLLYITFPVYLTNRWLEPFRGGWGGFTRWTSALDSITKATPLAGLREGQPLRWPDLFWGQTSGSLGETSALLILIGGLFIIIKKAASWRLAASCLLGGTACTLALRAAGITQIPSPLSTLLAGSFLFGAFFVVTEPVSGPKTKSGQWIYGSLIGALIVVLRAFSNFSEGVMFSVLIFNAFVPLLDQTIRGLQTGKKEART